MECNKCEFYIPFTRNINQSVNKCKILGIEAFKPYEDCKLVNEDGSRNEEEIKKDIR